MIAKFFTKFKKVLLTIIIIIAALLACFACDGKSQVDYRYSVDQRPDTIFIRNGTRCDTMIYRMI